MVLGVGVPSRGSRFLGRHDLKKAVVFGSAFLAGAFVFWENIPQTELALRGSNGVGFKEGAMNVLPARRTAGELPASKKVMPLSAKTPKSPSNV